MDGFLVASAAESAQLLRLAEVEHFLGAAYLQLAIAAATDGAKGTSRNASNNLGSSPRANDATAAAATAAVTSDDAAREMASQIEASRPTVAETVVAAAGWRRPWGFGNGPFSEVSATKTEIYVEGGGDDVDEQAIVTQLEVIVFRRTNAPWCSSSFSCHMLWCTKVYRSCVFLRMSRLNSRTSVLRFCGCCVVVRRIVHRNYDGVKPLPESCRNDSC